MPDYDDLMNVGSETGIETEEFYSSSISTKIKEDKCEKLEQKPTTKKCTLSLKKMAVRVASIMDGGTFRDMLE